MRTTAIWPSDVSCVIVTRGDRDLTPVLESLPPYHEVIIADGKHAGIEARYTAALKADKDVIYFQDDDLILHDHHSLLRAYEDDGRFYSNMIGPEWWQHCGYTDFALTGAGSLVPKELIDPPLTRYLQEWPGDEFFRRHTDFIFGVLAPFRRLELKTTILDSASDENALWKQDDQFEGKWEAVHRARALRNVVLTFLAKNEKENIERAIRSAMGLFDYVLVHDTGSTDGTAEHVVTVCGELGVPCTVRKLLFENFGLNRATLMGDAKQFGDYQLLMDADEELLHNPGSWDELCVDAYYLHYDGPLDYAQPRLVRSGVDWSWYDPVHSWLGTDEGYTEMHLQQPLIKHHGEEGDFSAERLERDLDKIVPLLEANPQDARSAFNLAKTLDGLGRFEEAKEAFRLRLEMGGWDEEKWYARYRLGRLTAVDDFDAGAQLLLDAWRERPWRIEPLRALAAFATQAADKCPYPYNDSLFVQRSHYRQEEESDAEGSHS